MPPEPESEFDLEKSVADWAVDCPAVVAVFEKLGIDYCCGGKSLEYACRQAGVEPRLLVAMLREK